jgi:hypothetical protein
MRLDTDMWHRRFKILFMCTLYYAVQKNGVTSNSEKEVVTRLYLKKKSQSTCTSTTWIKRENKMKGSDISKVTIIDLIRRINLIRSDSTG